MKRGAYFLSSCRYISYHSVKNGCISTKNNPVKPTPIKLKPDPTALMGETPLTDKFSRLHSYLRISLTEKCNLRCQYCMPLEGVPLSPPKHILRLDEIIRLSQIFAALGVDKVRLTGGEPTMRKDLVDIIEGIASIPEIKQIGMTSNGVALSGKLDQLVAAGLSKLNVSIDTLHEAKFQIMARMPGFKLVWKTIYKAESMFDMLKLNCVIMRNNNLDEVADFVELTRHHRFDVRFIEFMPFGGNDYALKNFVSYREMLGHIVERFGEVDRLQDQPNDTSKAYKVPGFQGKFGFITSMSEHFCNTCNRLRITADGNLKVCLHGNAEVSLRDAMRSGLKNEDLSNIIGQAVYRKKQRHAGIDKLMNITNRPMILIGNLLSCISKVIYSPLLYNTAYFSSLTHVDSHGKASMVDVSTKKSSTRIALAQSRIKLSPETFLALKSNSINKGDVLAVARIAAIQAAKKVSDLIPLCHQIPLTDVQVKFFLNETQNTIFVFGRAKANWTTGVEMEALTCSSVAVLVIYDMCKAMGHEMDIGEMRLVGKTGGKHNFGLVEFSQLDCFLLLT